MACKMPLIPPHESNSTKIGESSMKSAIQTLEQLRADLPITRSMAYFQTGTYAPVPLSTQQAMAEWLQVENESLIGLGGTGAAADFNRQVEAARQDLAGLLNVNSNEVAWS